MPLKTQPRSYKPNTDAYHQMALAVWIGFIRVTVITGRYPFLVGA
jgi:hypothetical protein